MTEEMIIAGFGGQGVLSMGKILAYSGIMQDQEVSWMPSYGPEMRGGTANVVVIVSDERISSPVLTIFDTAIILNQQSMDKFEKSVRPGGILIYDPNGITRHPVRKDINIYQIEGARLAAEMGNTKIFNMVILGAYLKLKPIVKLENVIKGLKKSLPERYHKLIPMNEDAVNMGMKNVVTFHQLN
ncbi:MAG: 2-oxoglutarate ferredoxin oxidoreductase subunit gamma [Bacteroidetes bacterium HGW-Bacteroidetes-1]|jgi:2-oxoglutarate ferredoxin oxidoreductase subunit gamma|nr:MAG: 2-oxoglutarate ferredoxin oxidoreductase subunit gamma [Bacteroidetes bacterium HGW-Bacteroidetes-1]